MTAVGDLEAGSSPSRLRRLRSRPGLQTLLIALLALLGTAHVLIRTHPYGVAVLPDSVNFLSTALSLLDGHGLQNFRGRPLVLQPPLFPATLAFFGLLGLHPWEAARLLNAAAFGSLILLSGLWLARNLRAPVLTVTATVALVAALPLNDAAAKVLTEPIFVVFVLAALTRLEAFLNGGTARTLLAAAAFTALAALTRYMGVALILAGGLLLLLAHRGPSLAGRWKHAIAFGVLSSLPLAVVGVRNWMLVGELAGDRAAYREGSVLDSIHEVADVFGGWLLPPNAPGWLDPAVLPTVGLILLVAAAVLVGSRRGLRAGRWPDVVGSPVLPFGAFMLVYVLMLVLIAPFTTPPPIADRYCLPVYAPLLLTGVFVLDRIASGPPGTGPATAGRVLAGVLLVGVLAHSAFSAMHNLALTAEVWKSGVNGRNYNTAHWNDSPVLRHVGSHVEGGTLSNAQELVWIADGMPGAPGRHRRIPRVGEGLPGLMRWMSEREGETVLVFLTPRPALGGNELGFNGLHLRLLPNVALVAELPDGAILRAKLGEAMDEEGYRAARDRYIPGLVATAGEPVVRSHWDLYLKDGRLIYVKPVCSPEDVAPGFFLRVLPEPGRGPSTLRRQRRAGDLDFEFHWFGLQAAGQCAAVVTLPRGPFAEVATGQYAPGGGLVWEARYRPPG